MLKTIFTIGVVALLGLFALKLIGVLFFPLIGLALLAARWSAAAGLAVLALDFILTAMMFSI